MMISYYRADGIVHLGHPWNDYTLCGDTLEGDDDVELSECIQVAPQAITCLRCLEIIELCCKAAEAAGGKDD